MKVAFFHDVKLKKYNDNYYTTGGVTKEYLQKYLKFFQKVTLCVREEKAVEAQIKKLSITSGKNIDINPIIKTNILSLIWGKQKKKIREIIKENDFSIIRLPSLIGIIACREINKTNKKYIIEMVGCPLDSYWNHGSILGKFVAPIMYLINKYYIRKAKNVVYVSNEFLQKRYPNKNNNIGCSDVKIEECSLDVLNSRLQKIKNKKSSDSIKIGLIGSLNVKYKGQDLAIKAMSELKDKYNNLELHFLGAGNKEKWNKKIEKYKLKDIVYFDGTLPSGKEVYNWMDQLDIYLIPSLTEGMPRALIEAMSRACPCIGTNVGGIAELLDKEVLIKKNKYKELKEKIEKLINNKEILRKCAVRNFDKIQQFQYDKLIEKNNEFYCQILKEVEDEESLTCSK